MAITTDIPSTVKQGSKGANVTKLQTILNDKGYDCGTADGIFGKNTKKAVVSYQRAESLTADGIVGRLTWSKLLGIEEEHVEITCEDLKQFHNPHGPMVYGKDKTWGTYKGGACGPTSFSIVQRAYGLAPDGETSTQTIQRIGQYAVDNGYRIKGNGTRAGLFSTNGCSASGTTNKDTILNAIRGGKLVILNIGKGFPNGYTGGGHYLVAYGISGAYLLLHDVGSAATARQRCLIDKMGTGLKRAYIITKR